MGGHVEREGLVEDGVETALHGHRLLLLHALVFVHQPHLHVWICTGSQETEMGAGTSHKDSPRFDEAVRIMEVGTGDAEPDDLQLAHV